MHIILSTLASMGARLLAGPIIEKVILILLEQAVKLTDSTVDDKLFETVKEALEK